MVGACVACGGAEQHERESLTELGPSDAGFDAALAFDGVDDYATTGSAKFPQIERPQTHSLWVKPEGALAGRQCLLVLRRAMSSGIALTLEDGVPLAVNVWGPRDLVRAEAPLPLAEWHHLAYVLESAGSKLYVDGRLVGTGSPPATNRTPTLGFIGSMDGFSEMFRGSLDEVRVYDRALTGQEVAAEFVGEPAAAEQLVLYLPFNEATGARAYDRSGLGNHAALGDGILGFMPARVVSDAPRRPR